MSALHFLRLYARQNAWANYRLYQAMRPLTDEEFRAPGVSFFPSLSLTLNHILVVDWYYLDALQGGAKGRSIFNDMEPCKSVESWYKEQRASDKNLVAFCEALTEADLARPAGMERRHGVEYDRVDAILNHLFQHQIHHRGQAHALLSGTRVKPPQLDEFFLREDARVRADELAALGLPEHTEG